ncbi:MAG: hypothetical protein H0U86_12700 [Chloroflexi bacterium]|nr:hypothetical protein [Chloroflexota bacterium]
MPWPVEYQPDYDRVRDQLSPGDRLLVGEAEDRIAENPDPRLDGRFEVDGYIYDRNPQDFVIEYRMLDQGWISLDRLIDLRNPDL